MVKTRSGRVLTTPANESGNNTKINNKSKLPPLTSNTSKGKSRRWSSMNSQEFAKLSNENSPEKDQITSDKISSKTMKKSKRRVFDYKIENIKKKKNKNIKYITVDKDDDTFLYLFVDLCIWKPTDVTFTLWTCIIGVIVSHYYLYLIFTSNIRDVEIIMLVMSVTTHIIDCLWNFVYAVNNDSDVFLNVIIHSEALNNAIQLLLIFMLLEFMSIGYIWLLTMTVLVILSSNIKFRNDSNFFVRLLTYLPFCVLFGYIIMYFAEVEINLYYFFICVFTALFFDITDLPDSLFESINLCESVILASRTVSLYFLCFFFFEQAKHRITVGHD